MPKQVQLAEPALEKAEVAHLSQVESTVTDTDKGSHHSHGSEGDHHKQQLKKAERRLLLKLGKSKVTVLLSSTLTRVDFGILPFAVLLYLAAYLDRGNL